MIPQLVTVRWRRRGNRVRRLWIPVVPVALLLSPLLVLAVIGGVVACLLFDMSPLRMLGGIGRVLWTLPGTRFELEMHGTAVFLGIR
ncbi:hypothetical protein [Glycomyces albidus]|uniref:Uncharacterized protein n=1 Tax=Glycomyces albidus TaxID=2656774 RepID=A0A6L5GBD3_9ACTN|nr:hypothetical protein [Glycomyces albidus]MQM26989.1 hypothetical protein [Glycomyces albidus]